MPFLEIGSDEVHFVGIWSMGGTGKTTLARVVFEKVSNMFEKYTTRDSHVLTALRVKRIYEMKMMKKDESLQLFCNKTFRKYQPKENYSELTESIVKYAGGLPLALEVLGSFLCGRSEVEWRDALDRLERILANDIIEVLRISYDGLHEEEKTIFLDIACFFSGWTKKEVTLILKGCGIYSKIGIKVLIEKALLVKTGACTFEMHDLLQDLGRYIVHQESQNVGKRSRLWEFDEIKEVLENNKGSKEIQAIVMPDKHDIVNIHFEAFSEMSNIRLLILSPKTFKHRTSRVNSPRGLKLSSALKVVRWSYFELDALLLENPLEKLVHIEMRNSRIKQLWNGIPIMRKLKFINLKKSMNLVETPDFSEIPYLEYLCLSRCKSLVKVHHSLGKLKALAKVDLRLCENLEIIPTKLETNSLTMLNLRHCKKLAVLPEFGEGMKKLSYIDISETVITRLPESLESLTSLRNLDLGLCKILNLDTLLKVTSLTNLCLSGLDDGSIPDDFGSLSSLVALDLSHNNFVDLPSGCFSSLFQLQFLSLDSCPRLKSLPRLPPRLIGLHATSCPSMETPLSSDEQIWNLVASFDHERKCALLRDFFAIIRGCGIPSWFSNNTSGICRNFCVIEVNIPPDFRDSEWLGIVVCLPIICHRGNKLTIYWSTKAPEDDGFLHKKEWGYLLWL
ncbi:hypothetical protein K1719_026690 [Acacia pycnantha]|nr:hypothetical protein K1719_026690 [Acacia pycnantha]